MKIMFYIGNLKKGGAERVVSVLANNFAKENEVAIMTTKNDEIDYIINRNIEIFPLDDGNYRNVISKNLFYLKKIKNIVKLYNPDVILTFLLEPSYRMLFLKQLIRKKIIVSDRNDPKIEYSDLKNRIIMKLLYRKADGFVFQTSEAQSYFSNKIKNKSVVIFNPVEEHFFKANYNYNGNKEIINVGRLTEQKNQLLLIKSFQRVLQVYPDFKLVIYGDGPLKDKLYDYIKENKLIDSIKLEGVSNEIENVLKDKYAFVLSSKYEGMPNALMEAMAIGMPCISTDCPCGGAHQLISNNVNGVLIENNNEDELYYAIIDLIENRDKCNMISKNAKKSMNDFSVDNIGKKWLDFINRTLNNK